MSVLLSPPGAPPWVQPNASRRGKCLADHVSCGYCTRPASTAGARLKRIPDRIADDYSRLLWHTARLFHLPESVYLVMSRP